MTQLSQNIFVLWDLSSAESRIALQTLARDLRLSFADPKIQRGDSLDELVRRISLADRILVVHPPDEALVAVAFETGLAIGLGKPIAILELSKPGSLAYAINVHFGPALPEDSTAPDLAAVRERLQQPSFWHEVPLPVAQSSRETLFLCPEEGVLGKSLRETAVKLLPDWSSPIPEVEHRALVQAAVSAGRLLWILIPDDNPRRPWGNVLAALSAGVFYGASRRLVGGAPEDAMPVLELLCGEGAPQIRSLEHLAREFQDLDQLVALLSADPEDHLGHLRIDRLTISNFKNIENLELDFTAPSSLPGHWRCIAGINGSGKTAILQALTLALIGPVLGRELGGPTFLRMLRRVGAESRDAEIRAHVRFGAERATLSLDLDKQLIDSEEALRGAGPFHRLARQVIVAYGASRNLSSDREDRYNHLTARARRQMTLFDPRARVKNVELLLDGGPADPALGTLRRLVEAVLGDELKPSPGAVVDRLELSQTGSAVEAIDLPDGFRSTVTWLADLCATWHEVTGIAEPSNPSDIHGLVLIDEIDLHLHPSLQRALVPRLREALPNVQFIVTTHSPLVLSSFDRNEIIALDRNAEGGVRALDRQIFGFSADEIYRWLMETPPQSLVIEEELQKGDNPDLALYLYQSEERDEEEARAKLDERRRLFEKLLGTSSR